MRLVTAGWVMGIIWMLAVTGSRLNVFARMLGFNDFHFGMITAVTFLATLAQLFATIAVERSGLKKYQFLIFASISRMLWIVIAAIPFFFPVPSPAAVWTMLALVLVSHVMMSLALPAWWTWMGDLLPRRIRGQYFAVRNIISHLVRIPVVVALGLLLDNVTRGDPSGGAAVITAAGQPVLLWCVCGVFALAGVLGTIDILMFFGIREVVGTTPVGPADGVKVTFQPRPNETVTAWLLAPEPVARRLQLETKPLRGRLQVALPRFWGWTNVVFDCRAQ